MKNELVEILSDASNMAVMRHPGREYPGSLIQGDSLHILVQDLKEVNAEINNGNLNDASEILSSIVEDLEVRLEEYKRALREHGQDLPFVE